MSSPNLMQFSPFNSENETRWAVSSGNAALIACPYLAVWRLIATVKGLFWRYFFSSKTTNIPWCFAWNTPETASDGFQPNRSSAA